MDILIIILLIIAIGLIFFNTFKNSNDSNQSDDFLKGIDHSIETQRTTTRNNLCVTLKLVRMENIFND